MPSSRKLSSMLSDLDRFFVIKNGQLHGSWPHWDVASDARRVDVVSLGKSWKRTTLAIFWWMVGLELPNFPPSHRQVVLR